MIGRGTWGVGAWMLAGVIALAWAALGRAVPMGTASPVLRRPSSSFPARPYPPDSLARLVMARPLFRVNRRPTALAYDPQRAVAPVESYRPPKPALALVGFVSGPDPTAVIEGLPGIEGSRVVRTGDVVGGLRVKRIERDGVVIVGMDTTWVLKVREPWK